MHKIIKQFKSVALILLALIISILATEANADMRSLLKRHPFNGAFIIAQHGKVLFRQGSPSLAYQIGSITKMFTAACILKLQEQGRLHIQDPLSKYIDFPSGNKITLEDLLSHTSGVPDYLIEMAVSRELANYYQSYHSKEDLLSLFNNRPLQFTPGSQFRYSNANYILLGLVIEKVSGMKYEDFVTRTILLPAKMLHTGVSTNPRHALVAEPKIFEKELRGKIIDLSNYSSAGGIVSTVDDMYAFASSLISGKIISQQSMAEMVRERKSGSGYGLGWTGYAQGNRYVGGHGGRTFGYSAFLDIDTFSGTIIVALSNDPSTDIDRLRKNIKNILDTATLGGGNF